MELSIVTRFNYDMYWSKSIKLDSMAEHQVRHFPEHADLRINHRVRYTTQSSVQVVSTLTDRKMLCNGS